MAKLEQMELPMEGVKYDEGKNRLDLIPVTALIALGQVYTHGAGKYADHNWMKGLKYSRVIGALKRHLAQFEMGEETDRESGCLHMASVAWCAFTLIHFSLFPEKYQGFDDRVALDSKAVLDMIQTFWDREHAPLSAEPLPMPHEGNAERNSEREAA